MNVIYEKGRISPMDTNVIDAVEVDKTKLLKETLDEAGVTYSPKLGEKKLQALVNGLEK